MSKVLILPLGLLLIASAAGIALTEPQSILPANAEKQRDTYAIYSAMIASPTTQQRGSRDEIYLIEGTTTTAVSGGPACVKAPPADTTSLNEVIADYNQRANASAVLAEQFTLSKPYQLLDRTKVRDFLNDALAASPQSLPRSGAAPVNQNPLFPKAKQVYRFSEVYFNRARTLALGYVAIYTTSVDYIGSWIPFKKTENGRWEENKAWTACGAGATR